MSSELYSHPGYIYQIGHRGDGDIQSILEQASGIKEKEQALYVYLIPKLSTTYTNPFNNYRLKSIMNEVEVVVFDTPPEKERIGHIEDVCAVLQNNYSDETLLRINNSLTESLQDREIDITKVDEKVSDDPEKLALAVALKVMILLSKNLGAKQTSLDSVDFTENQIIPTSQLEPKQRIHHKAEEMGKAIEYIDEREFIEKNKELLFDKGFLELVICSVIKDKELFQAFMQESKREAEAWNTCTSPNAIEILSIAEKNPVFIDLHKKYYDSDHGIDEMFILCEKINTYLTSKKKILLVLGKRPQDLKKLIPIISVTSESYANISLKGPIKEPTGCFWKIKKNDATIGYLLGSIHITPNYLLDLNSRIHKCFDKSGRLVVEIDVTRKDIVKSKNVEVNKFWTEQYSALSTEQIERLSSTLQMFFPEDADKVDFSIEVEESAFIFKGIAKLKFRIWNELEIYSGIDRRLLEQAKELDKPVEDLETFEQYAQLKTTQKMFAEDPLRDFFLEILPSEVFQEIEEKDEVMKILIEQISNKYKECLQPLFDAWEEGNIEIFDVSKTDSTDEKMDMTQRNMSMAMKIVNLVNEEEKIFCCIGAAHTVGEMSVRAFLKNFGFSTERVFV